MKFIGADGRIKTLKNARNYSVKWDKPSRSKFQTSVKNFLRAYWESDMVFEEMRIVGTRLSLDLYNAHKKVAVEVQGQQHIQFVPHFHVNRLNFRKQLSRDEAKFIFCQNNDITLIEIYPKDEINRAFFQAYGNIL